MENRFALGLSIFVVCLGIVSTEVFEAAVPCINDEHCKHPRLPENARCQANVCICPDNKGQPTKCVAREVQPKAAFHNPVFVHTCKVDQDCALSNGICNMTRSQCECIRGFVMATQQWNCLAIAKEVGAPCEDEHQCHASPMGNTTTCRNQQCVCTSGYHYYEGTCWKSMGFGEPCTRNQECAHVENAECNEQLQCACSKESVLNSDGQRCLIIATELLASCVERSQCTKNFPALDCVDKRCQCRDDKIFENSTKECVSSQILGKSCSGDHECFQEKDDLLARSQHCVDNICVCNENFRQHGDSCVAVSGASSLLSVLVVVVLSAVLSLARS